MPSVSLARPAANPSFVLIFSPALARRLHNARFGHGVFVERPATEAEARARFLAETYSVEERRLADRFGLTLAEARELAAERAEVLAELEMDRLDALDRVNQAAAEVEGPEGSFASDLARAAFGPARPTLRIRATVYEVERLTPAPECGVAAVRLHKAPGVAYDLVREPSGYVRCDCPDFVFRHEGTATTCKHAVAANVAGLLDPAPARRREPAMA